MLIVVDETGFARVFFLTGDYDLVKMIDKNQLLRTSVRILVCDMWQYESGRI